jgi:hypothetical protein
MIRNTIKPLALVAFVAMSHLALSAQGSQSEVESIRQTFLSYKAAILQRQGQSALSCVNRSTLQHYARMKALALEGQEKEIRQLTPLNKLIVLLIRHRVPVDDLRGMTSEELFIHGVNQGWIGKDSILDSDIGQLQVFGNDASAEYVMRGNPTQLKFRFTKEDGKWRIDLTALMSMADHAMSMMIKEEGLEEDTLIISVIELVSGKKAPPTIWQPLGK